jgi:hypothetical protein
VQKFVADDVAAGVRVEDARVDDHRPATRVSREPAAVRVERQDVAGRRTTQPQRHARRSSGTRPPVRVRHGSRDARVERAVAVEQVDAAGTVRARRQAVARREVEHEPPQRARTRDDQLLFDRVTVRRVPNRYAAQRAGVARDVPPGDGSAARAPELEAHRARSARDPHGTVLEPIGKLDAIAVRPVPKRVAVALGGGEVVVDRAPAVRGRVVQRAGGEARDERAVATDIRARVRGAKRLDLITGP